MIIFKSSGKEFGQIGNLYAAAGKNAPRAVMLAVREVGQKSRTAMRRAVRQEIGLQHKIARHVNKQVLGKVVSGAFAEYHIEGKGSIALKHFKTVQSTSGVSIPGVDKKYLLNPDLLAKAFEGTTGHAGTRGDRNKRRATLDGNIVVASRGVLRGTGKVGNRIRKVPGVSVPRVFLSQRSEAEFYRTARGLPRVLSRILFAALNGKLRSRNPAWKSYAKASEG